MPVETEEEILIWIRPTSEVIRDGEVVFLNGRLRDTSPEKFEGLASLRKLAASLKKPVFLCAVESDGTLLPWPRFKLEATSTDKDLEELAKEANASLTYMSIPGNTHFGFQKVPTFFVGRC